MAPRSYVPVRASAPVPRIKETDSTIFHFQWCNYCVFNTLDKPFGKCPDVVGSTKHIYTATSYIASHTDTTQNAKHKTKPKTANTRRAQLQMQILKHRAISGASHLISFRRSIRLNDALIVSLSSSSSHRMRFDQLLSVIVTMADGRRHSCVDDCLFAVTTCQFGRSLSLSLSPSVSISLTRYLAAQLFGKQKHRLLSITSCFHHIDDILIILSFS